MLTGQENAETPRSSGVQDIIVRLAEDADAARVAALRETLGAELAETTLAWGFELWRCEGGIDAEALAAAGTGTAAAAGIAYLQENLALDALDFTADPRAGELWALDNAADTDIDLPDAWESSRGAGVLVAVIDTGVDYAHPDLAANIWVNPGEIPGNGLDDDGNGLVDDIHGYDFVETDARPTDGHSHGTHVAGTIAAVAGNGIGIAGVAPEAEIMAVKIMSDDGTGSLFDAIQGIEYAALMGAQIANCSWGGASYPTALADAIALAGQAGMTIVAAAGNDAKDTDLSAHYPAAIAAPNIISVAATDRDGGLASYSNYGIVSVDVAAPGTGILSTLPGAGYGTKSGTSMATPHVSGIAALILASEPWLTPAELRQRLIDSSDPVAELAARTVSGGRVNAAAAVEGPALAAISGRVAEAGGAGVAGWTVFLDTDGDGQRDAGEAATLTAADGRYSFAGLAPGRYDIAVALPDGWKEAGARPEWRAEDTPVAWQELSGRGERLELGDEGLLGFDLPFDAVFYGRSFDRLTVSANGIVSFGSPEPTYRVGAMERAPDWSIAPFWADLTSGYGGQVLWLTEPDRITLQYSGVRSFSGEALLNFEVMLARDGSISFAYGDMSGLPDRFAIGLRGGSESESLSIGALPETGGLTLSYDTPDTARVSVEATSGAATAPQVTVTATSAAATTASGAGTDATLAAAAATGTITGTLWQDGDGDGRRDPGEAVLAGHRVWIDLDGDGTRQAAEPQTGTDGSYRFSGLAEGAYSLRQELQAGWVASAATDYMLASAETGWRRPPPRAVDIDGIGDDGSAVIDLPFLFPFFGAAHAQMTVSADGYLSFGSAGDGGLVSALQGDLDAGPGRIRAWSDSGGTRMLIDFRHLAAADGTGNLGFQIQLYADGRIQIAYRSLEGAPDGAVTGISGASGQELRAAPAAGDTLAFLPVATDGIERPVLLGPGAPVAEADFGSLPGADSAGGSSHFDMLLRAALQIDPDLWL
ncbi:S8 family serine peptidase [Poseidonocella sp. HB161398]|uniref:S8 family serine peptidase n=1 Tax=Poseidonocella sp. HB161398 TaxID=2320855 RepID=UPI001108DE9E|nr:S8 family serine peptidase [Poseidonocella sp. HB161398]